MAGSLRLEVASGGAVETLGTGEKLLHRTRLLLRGEVSVVLGSPLGRAQRLVGERHLGEDGFHLRFERAEIFAVELVGVVLGRHPVVGALDLLLLRSLGNAEQCVVVQMTELRVLFEDLALFFEVEVAWLVELANITFHGSELCLRPAGSLTGRRILCGDVGSHRVRGGFFRLIEQNGAQGHEPIDAGSHRFRIEPGERGELDFVHRSVDPGEEERFPRRQGERPELASRHGPRGARNRFGDGEGFGQRRGPRMSVSDENGWDYVPRPGAKSANDGCIHGQCDGSERIRSLRASAIRSVRSDSPRSSGARSSV